jgi:hypothetical protein
VAQAIDLSEREALDLPGALISTINGSDGCERTVSFDEAFAATGEAVELGSANVCEHAFASSSIIYQYTDETSR